MIVDMPRACVGRLHEQLGTAFEGCQRHAAIVCFTTSYVMLIICQAWSIYSICVNCPRLHEQFQTIDTLQEFDRFMVELSTGLVIEQDIMHKGNEDVQCEAEVWKTAHVGLCG